MATGPSVIETVTWKLNRAREISETLDSLFSEFAKSNFYAIGQKTDRKKRLCLIFKNVEPIPAYYSLMLSEAIHHLRTSLDHMVWAMASPRTESQAKRVGFPICSTSKKFRDVRGSSLIGIGSNIVRLIERVQPYHSRRWPESRYLDLLRDLSNWDKHSAIVAAAAGMHDSHVDVKITGKTSVADSIAYRGAIENEKVLFRLLPGWSEAGATIQFYPDISVYPVFDKAMPKSVRNKGVRDTVNGAGAFIQECILPSLSPYI